MEDGRIANYQITASSAKNHGTEAYFGRLNDAPVQDITNGVWTAYTQDKNQWIRVNFGVPRLLTGIITQGRPGKDQWVTQYKVQFGDDGVNWQYVVDSQKHETVNLHECNFLMDILLTLIL